MCRTEIVVEDRQRIHGYYTSPYNLGHERIVLLNSNDFQHVYCRQCGGGSTGLEQSLRCRY
jgi:hypothetical protein